MLLKDARESSSRHPDWAWSKESFVVLPNRELASERNLFDCEVSLPEVQFVRRKSTVYSPGEESCSNARRDSFKLMSVANVREQKL